MGAPAEGQRDHTTRWPDWLYDEVDEHAEEHHERTGEPKSFNRSVRELTRFALEMLRRGHRPE
jgi:hypothetical protein